MKNHASWLASLMFVFAAACTAHVSTGAPPPAQPMPPPPPGQPAPPPAAVDNGQPKMHATLAALQRAQSELTAAAPNKGGHRERGLKMIEEAVSQVQQGIEYANAHPNEVGAPEPAAAPEPVNTQVPGAQTQPHMANAVIALREARKQLGEAKGDKGGHRKKGIEIIDKATREIQDGIGWADQHH